MGAKSGPSSIVDCHFRDHLMMAPVIGNGAGVWGRVDDADVPLAMGPTGILGMMKVVGLIFVSVVCYDRSGAG